jgi:hypothetical protein
MAIAVARTRPSLPATFAAAGAVQWEPGIRTGGKPMKKLLTYVSLGWLAAWFLDPQSGSRRRAMARDRALTLARRTQRRSEETGGDVAAQAEAVKQQATHREEEPKGEIDDTTLARKVETEIFRADDAPKGSVNVNAEYGKVYLRGEVESPELIEELVAKTRAVQGVKDVENLLHLPGQEAPTHQ